MGAPRTAGRMRARRLLLAGLVGALAAWPVTGAVAQDVPSGGIAARARLDPSEDIAFRAMAIPDTVWVGQQATYQVGVFLSAEIRARLRRNPVFVPPELRSMLAFDLASLASVPRIAGDRRYEVHVFQRALFPLTAGRHEIPPARLEYALPLSNSFFAREESHSARTQGLVVIAREPPPAGRPADFRGAVGRLSLQVRLDGRPQRTGDPFTYTAVVLGTGNVSLLPRPDLAIPWADVVPGAVRVQMDSSTTLVRGRKEFDWIVTPTRPGRQSVPAIRYPFFNPYSERYEVALSLPESLVVTGERVVADRASADSAPAPPIRRTYEGEVPAPITTAPLFWVLVALAPLPFLASFVGRRRRPTSLTSPEAQLLGAAREGGADAALVRRIFARALADRTQVTASEMSDPATLGRALRRAGVSAATAGDAAALLSSLDESVFGGPAGTVLAGHAERAAVLLKAIDSEASARSAIAARRARRAATTVMLLLASALAAWASQDLVAAKVFADGLAAWDAREYGSARQSFHELAQARPRAPDAWYNFAAASWQVEDTAAAVVGWQRAMRLDPMATDARDRLRLAPGTPRLWHGVPPFSLTMVAACGAGLWLLGFLLLALARRRGVASLTRIGSSLVAGAVLVMLGGIRQREILDGREVSVVLSPTRLRAMPVLSADAGIEAQPGEVARVLGHQGAWTRVELSDRRRGWVEAQRLEPVAQGSDVTWSITR